MGTMNSLPRELTEYSAIPMKGYVCARDIGAMAYERVAIPANAIAVLFSASDHFVAMSGDGAVSVTWPADDDTGVSAEVNPTIRRLDGVDTHIAVMMKNAGQVSLRFFTMYK